MIKENQLVDVIEGKASKFFTTDGSDIWQLEDIKQVTQLTLRNMGSDHQVVCSPNDSTSAKFHLIKMPKIESQKPVRVKTNYKTTDSSTKKNKRTKSQTDKNKYIKSEYKGVRGERTKKGITWQATVWDKNLQKAIYLGCFDDEFLAAASVAENKGDKQKAKELRTRSEQAKEIANLRGENNPETFICEKCGVGYEQKPDQCQKCSSTNIKPIRQRQPFRKE